MRYDPVVMSRYLPLVGSVLFVAIAVCWRPWWQRRRYGSSGILLFRSGRRGQDVRDGLAVVLFVLVVGQAAATARWPPRTSSLATEGLLAVVWDATGAALLFGGLVVFVTSQVQLGPSWRIGIEEGARPGLVTGGVYRFCRNPIYLAMLVLLTGYTMLLRTWLSLALLVGALVGLRQQVRAEEAYLLRTYGEDYRRYARRVGRFLPRMGRVR